MLSRRSLMGAFPLGTALFATSAVAQDAAPTGGALGAGGGTLRRGVYRVDSDLTVEGDLMLEPGASILIAKGRTLTIAGGFSAPISPIFSGEGTVDMNRSRVTAAHPEWWGARTGDGNHDNLAPLNACLAAHPVMQLQCADYFIPDTWKIGVPNRTIRGAAKNWRGPDTATRLIIERPKAGTADVVQIGPDRRPGTIEQYLFNVRLSDVHLCRDGLLTPPPSGRERESPVGLRLQYCVDATIQDVSSENSAIGFYIGGVVHSFMRRCIAMRSVPGGRSTGDFFWGYYFDGEIETGLAGGNASVYVEECGVSGPGVGAPIASIAAFLRGAFADTYLTGFECAGCRKGILLEGMARYRGARPVLKKTGNGDVHIIMPVLDQVRSGIELAELSDYAVVDIVTPYVAVTSDAFAAVHAHDGGGQVTITGGQLIGWGNSEPGGAAFGIHAVEADGLAIRGVKLLGFRRPVELKSCGNFDLDVLINNPDQVTSQAAVLLEACRRVSVRAGIKGRNSAFPTGVELKGDANSAIAVECTQIDPRCLARGAEKLRIADKGIRSAGPVGTHLATGMMS